MPFNPKYKNTNKISKNLSMITAVCEIIERACLFPELEEKLRRQALIRNAHASTALAGNKLTLKEAEALFSRSVKLRKNAKP